MRHNQRLSSKPPSPHQKRSPAPRPNKQPAYPASATKPIHFETQHIPKSKLPEAMAVNNHSQTAENLAVLSFFLVIATTPRLIPSPNNNKKPKTDFFKAKPPHPQVHQARLLRLL